MTDPEIPFLTALRQEVTRTAVERTLPAGAPGSAPPQLKHWFPGRGRRPLLAVISTTIVVAVCVGLLLSGGGGSGLSIVARAYAATSNRGTILYYRYTSTGILPAGNRSQPEETAQVWSTTQQSHTIDRESNLTDIGHGHVRRVKSSQESTSTPTFQTDWFNSPGAFAKGIIVRSVAKSSTRCDGLVSALFGSAQYGACGTPISAVHDLLASQKLHVSGRMTLDGQKVDVLTGSPEPPPHAPRVQQVWTVTVDVNVNTFAPVEVREHQVLFTHGPTVTGTDRVSGNVVVHFGAFKRLDVSAANEKLLNMRPHPGAVVIRCPSAGRCTTVHR